MWSVGVIIFVLLCGYPPFVDDNQSVLFQKVRVGDWSFDEKHWSNISKDAKHLIGRLLVVNPLQRWTAKQCLESKWLNADESNFSKAELTESVVLMKRRKSGGLVKGSGGGMWGNSRVDQPPSKSMDAVEYLLSRAEVDEESKEGEDEETSKGKLNLVQSQLELVRFTI
jgi:serine/threonine protein kinase